MAVGVARTAKVHMPDLVGSVMGEQKGGVSTGSKVEGVCKTLACQ